ncbi:histone-lysine N-methyltransferase SETDB1 isoform X1 [Folsomia candida]|uniref:histone-lysine N-methyltransferase SETDB1 isoform X1 n=1 Tax=Folsomia candida TaxID=158441 RepID=UPI0016052B8D|nr:histone-lysine N-methyltransferase SETDB1 isoform X1 [Folsomia candida]
MFNFHLLKYLVIDVAKMEMVNECNNANCKSNSDELVIAKEAAILYYRFDMSHKKVHKICKTCDEDAETFMQNSVNALKNDENIFAFKTKPEGMEVDVIEIKDDEEDDNNPAEIQRLETDNNEILELSTSVDNLIGEVMTKLDLASQIAKCEETTTMEFENLEEEYCNLKEQVSLVEGHIAETKKIYNKVAGYEQPLPVIAVELDLSVTETLLESMLQNVNDFLNFDDAPPDFQPTPSPESAESNLNGSSAEKENSHSDDDDIVEVVPGEGSPQKLTCPLTRPLKDVPRLVPLIGGSVYAQKRTLLHYWARATIEEILDVGAGKSEFLVRFVRGDGRLKQLTAKQIAYDIPCPFMLIVGTRVIAKFREDLKEKPHGPDGHYAGIVAEQPTPRNKFRYLIFFDDGCAQYVGINDILLIHKYSKEVWSDVHPDSAEFIKNYLRKYPERPMVRLTLGQVISTEWNGKWWVARVTELDCSLAKMHFENDGRWEWIYRGCTRFSPLFEKYTRQRQRKIARQSTSALTYHESYQQSKDGDDWVPSHGRKKRTEPTPGTSASALEKQHGDIKRLTRFDYGEFEGTIAKRAIPSDAPLTKEYSPHVCDHSCVYEYDDSNPEYKKIGPLTLPLHFGFTREIAESPYRSIYYRGPCGLRLHDMEEMYDYLTQTKCQIQIDHFCFDLAEDCLNEFRHSRQHSFLPDLTYGKEPVPVQLVNAFDHEFPPYVEYLSQRVAGSGVNFNNDEEFLVGCDCEDDCRDATKCSCWQMTHSGISFSKFNTPENPITGYEYRRLKNNVFSGIYECNQRCKCAKTCCNRVAQNGLKVPLQLFKTAAKGWGIRPIFDVPEGAFICIYAGQVLTEDAANDDGQQFGDEYLASLDYIEHIEKLKEDYESEVTDIEADEPVAHPKKKIKTRKERPFNTRGKNNAKKTSSGAGNSKNKSGPVITPPKTKVRRPLREYFGEHDECYIMDAKTTGNIGRYFNHSCEPNIFVQNVFVDTHDLRFPWITFFASKHIRAGSELTWDYAYEVGSIPDKVLLCQCGSPECRGRLL